VEAEIQDDGTAVCPRCENSVVVTTSTELLSHIASLQARNAELETTMKRLIAIGDKIVNAYAMSAMGAWGITLPSSVKAWCELADKWEE